MGTEKTCFVISPLGKPGGDIRLHADLFYNQIVKSVLEPLGYKVERGDLLTDCLSIPDSISKHIFQADLIIADLTECNPNVLYELGKAHAWGGKCVHLVNAGTELPFDVTHLRVIRYNFEDENVLQDAKTKLYKMVRALENAPIQCPYPLTPDKLISLSGATIVVERKEGKRDHYYLAERLAETECSKIFLMQRSSSLILGAELGWGAEKTFYHALIAQIKQGAAFFHVVSLDGVARHLERAESSFPEIESALQNLSREGDVVGICGNNNFWHFKKSPEVSEIEDMKPDRQARTFMIERQDGTTEGVLVVDVGGMQSCFHIKGQKMKEYFNYCVKFYESCHLLKWHQLRQTLCSGGVDVQDYSIPRRGVKEDT